MALPQPPPPPPAAARPLLRSLATNAFEPPTRPAAGLCEALERTPAAAKYRLLRPLSRGAFGSVVLAVQQNSGEQCAIKAMRIG